MTNVDTTWLAICPHCGHSQKYRGNLETPRPPCPHCQAGPPATTPATAAPPSSPPPKSRVMPWGKYKGRTLEDIAEEDRGLLYLDWLIGQKWMDKSTPLSRQILALLKREQHRLDSLLFDE